jgi:hypothetical protein
MTRRRTTARAIYLFSGVLIALVATFAACADLRFGLGEECLKDPDCLSGICTGGRCTAAPPIGTVSPVDATPDTSMGEAGGEAAADATGDTASDTSSPADAADGPPAVDANHPDAPDGATPEAGSDASDASGPDAALDATPDAADAADDSG